VALTSVYFRRNDTEGALNGEAGRRARSRVRVAVLDLALAFQAAGHPDEAARDSSVCWRSIRAT
jgi:hypothetical protein